MKKDCTIGELPSRETFGSLPVGLCQVRPERCRYRPGTFQITSGAAVGGDGIEVSVREMYYNDRLIIKNSDYSREEGIVIMKR